MEHFERSLTGQEFDVAKYQKVDAGLNRLLDQHGDKLVEHMSQRSRAAAQETVWIQAVHTN